MKLLFTEGVGAVQTTTNAQDEKIKVFASEGDMLDNIDTLQENEIVATNDATEADLIGNMLSDINALKAQQRVGFPDIREAVRTLVPNDVDYTLTEDCWIFFGATDYVGYRYFYVNGIEIGRANAQALAWEDWNTIFLPLKAGNVIKSEGENALCYIYPMLK